MKQLVLRTLFKLSVFAAATCPLLAQTAGVGVELEGLSWARTDLTELRKRFAGLTLHLISYPTSYAVHVGSFQGIRSRVTYVMQSLKLRGILIEPLGEGNVEQELAENYLRPTMSEAYTMRESLLKAMVSYYGPPDNSRLGLEAKLDSWGWGTEQASKNVLTPLQSSRRGETEGYLSLRVIDDGRADVRLWIQTTARGSSWNLDTIRNPWTATPKETWSEHGAFDVVWGMGPADVRDIYAGRLNASRGKEGNASVMFGSEYDASPISTLIIIDRIETEMAQMSFSFFRGRLCSISIFAKPDGGANDVEGFRARYPRWMLSLKAILEEKYGSPTNTPQSTALRPNWLWSLQYTNVELRDIGVTAVLEYEDKLIRPQMEKAEAEYQKRKAEQEAESKANRKKRF